MTSRRKTKKKYAKIVVQQWKYHTSRDVKHYSRGIRRYKKRFWYMNPKLLGEQYMKKMMERHEKWLYEISSERIRDLLEKTNLNTNKAMKQKIQVTGKNIGEIFALPCVKEIKKIGYGEMVVYLYHHFIRGGAVFSDAAYFGDWLVEEDNGIWHVEEGGK